MLLAAETIVPVEGSGTHVNTRTGTGEINVTTDSLSDDALTGYNTFKTFGVPGGQTVNLIVPGGASNLLNVVRERSVTVDGVLNAMKDGKIGGNVYFAVPSGFVVGKTGAVNVGSLTVSTVGTAWTTDFDPSATLNGVQASDFHREFMNIPVVEGGLVSVRGKIHALGDVNLKGSRIEIDGTDGGTGRVITGVPLAAMPDIEKVVNIGDLSPNSANLTLTASGMDSCQISLKGAELLASGDISATAIATQRPDMSAEFLEVHQANAGVNVSDSSLSGGGNLSLAAEASTEFQMKRYAFTEAAKISLGRASTSATAVVDGASSLSSGGNISVNSDARTVVRTASEATEVSPAPDLVLPISATFTLTDVTNTSEACIEGTTSVSADGTLGVGATGLVDVTTEAVGSLDMNAGAAASLGLSFVAQKVAAAISGGATVTKSGNISVTADGKTDQATSATAAVGGADSKSPITELLESTNLLSDAGAIGGLIDRTATGLGTSPGSQVAGGFAFSETKHSVSAGIDTTGALVTSGDVGVKTRSLANVTTVSSGKTSGGSVGVGAAVSIATGSVTNQASVNSRVNAGGNFTVSAKTEEMDPSGTPDKEQSFSTRAYSGQGGKIVGVAGALALHTLTTETEADLGARANVVGDNLVVAATNTTSHEVVADGKKEDDAVASVGVGASLALNFAENKTRATLAGASAADMSGRLSLSATSVNTAKTIAVSGAAGGVAVVPVLALTNITDTTEAKILSGAGSLETDGTLRLTSRHTNTSETRAEGAATGGGTAAVGLAASVALTDDTGIAAIERDVTAESVDISAQSDVAVSSEGVAGAEGAAEEDDDESLSKKLTAFFGAKDAVKGDEPEADGKKKTDAETSEGGISVAAAVGVTDADSVNEARIGKSVRVTSSGTVSLAATSQMDVSAKGDGSAAGETCAVGAGVAVNVARQTGRAAIDEGAVVSGTALNLSSTTSNKGDGESSFAATGNAGAGGGGVSIAGAAAINRVSNTLEARVDGTLDFSHKISLESRNASRSEAKAGAAGEGDTAGIGASFASNLNAHKSLATLGAKATLAQRAGLSLSAINQAFQTTEAVAGNASSGGDAAGAALDAAVALTTDNNETRAVIEGGAAIETMGFKVIADASGTNLTVARGNASGNVAAGASVAVGTNNAVTEASLNRSANAHGNLAVSAQSLADDRVLSQATAKGAKAARYNADNPSESTKNLKKAKTKKNGIAVAAAVGVSTLHNQTKASLAGDITVSADGMDIAASETSRFETVGSGTSVAEGAAGVGVGVAVSELSKETSATVGAGTTLSAGGALTVSAESKRNADAASNGLLAARAEAGAGAKKVGVAGAVAIVTSSNTTEASIGAGTVRAGDTTVSAVDIERLAARAGSAAKTGGYTGGLAIGASFALVNAGSATRAKVDGNLITTGLTVKAERKCVGTETPEFSDLEDLTEEERESHRQVANHYAEAVAGGTSESLTGGAAVSGAFAVTTVTETTEASVAADAEVKVSGDVSIGAENRSRTRTIVGASSDSNSLGVGVSSATTVMDATISAFLGDNANVGAGGELAVRSALENDLAAQATSASGGLIGGAGAVVVNVVSNQTSVSVGSGATASAGSNMDIRAEDGSTVTGISGAMAKGLKAGIGGSVLVNTLLSETRADVKKGATLEACGAGDSRQVETGDADGSIASKGIALVAKAYQEVKGFVVSGTAGGGAGVTGSSSTTVVKTRTSAMVADGVKTTDAMATATGADLRVVAMDTTALGMTAGAAGAGGKAGFGAGVDVVSFGKTTTAAVGSDVRPQGEPSAALKIGGSLAISAASNDTQNTRVLGFAAGGTGALSGSVAVTTMANRVSATTGNGVSLSAGRNLTVDALEKADIDHTAGSAAVGGTAGVGASVSVMKVGNITQAVTGVSNILDSAGTLKVEAATYEGLQSVTAAGVGSGTVGMAGAVSVKTASSTTRSLLGSQANVNETVRGSAQDVVVAATHDLTLKGYGGSSAVGGVVGAGASADVATVRTTTTAEVGGDATVRADRNIVVSAASTKGVTSVTVAASGGGAVGISGATSLVFIGEALSNEARQSLAGEEKNDDGQVVASGNTGSQVDNCLAATSVKGEVSNTEAATALDDTGNITISSELNRTSAQLVTKASTGSGVTLKAGGSISVDSLDRTGLDITSGALAAGTVGVGGGVALAKVHNTTLAQTGADNRLSAGGTLRLLAQTLDLDGKVSRLRAFIGSAGLVGLGAAVAWLEEGNTTHAGTGSGNVVEEGASVTIKAEEDRTLDTQAIGGSAGALAVGIAKAYTGRDSQVTATLGASSEVGITPEKSVGSLEVTSTSRGGATSKALAGAGGVLSGAGALADTSVSSRATSLVADDATAKVTGDAAVKATTNLSGSSVAKGWSVGIASAGDVEANTSFDVATKARVGQRGTLEAGGDATVGAYTVINAGTYDEDANSFSGETATDGGGGGLVGIINTSSKVTVKADTDAEVGSGATLTAGDSATVEAHNGISAAARSELDSAGAHTSNNVKSTVTVTADTDVSVGEGATIRADHVKLASQTDYLQATATAYSKTYAGNSNSYSTTDVNITSDADVNVATGATIRGESSVTIRALQQNMAVVSSANSKIKGGLTGSLSSSATGNANVHAKVTLAPGSEIITSSLDVETESTVQDAHYTKNADTDAKTVVKLITTTIKTISKAVSWIPFVGKLVKKIVKWVTKVIEQVLNSTESTETHGTRIHGSDIVMDATVHLLGTANPELIIGEDGSVEKATAVTTTTDSDGNIVVGNIINDKIGKVRLSATDGTVTGSGVIYLKNSYDTVSVTNKSDRDVTLGQVQVTSQNNGEPNVEVISTNDHSFTIMSANDSGCSVTIDSRKGGDVVFTDEVNNQFGGVTVTTGGDIRTTGSSRVIATNLTLDAGGDIGAAGQDFVALMNAGVVRVDAGGNLALDISRYHGDAREVDGGYVLNGNTTIERLTAGETLALTLKDGTTRVFSVTETEDVLDGDGNKVGENQVITESNPVASAAYTVGTIEAGGDVSVTAANHANFTATRIASTGGDVDVAVQNGHYAVNQVEAQAGTVHLDVKGAITDGRGDDAWNIKGKSFDLTSQIAGIGSGDTLEVIQTGTGGALSASAAAGDIHLSAVENDLAFGGVTATGNIRVTGKSSLLDANGEAVNLTAGEVDLTSETGVIDVDTNSDKLTLSAARGIDVEEKEGDLNLTEAVSATGTVRLVAAGNLVDIDGHNAADVRGDRAELVAKNGHIGSSAQRFGVDARQGTIAASGNIHVDAEGNLALDGVTAADLADLSVAGNLTDHNGEAVNIAAKRVFLNSGGSIDTDTDAGILKVMATGSVDLEEIDGDLTLESVAAGGNVTLAARAGNLTAKDAAVDVKGAGVNLAASGSIGDAGNILNIDSNGVVNFTAGEQAYLRETDGTLEAGSLYAGKRIFLTADALANDGNADTRIATDELVVEARGDVIADTAAGSLDIAITGNGDLTLREKDDVSVNRIALANGDVDFVAGGDVLAGSGATHLAARNMTLRSATGGMGTTDGRLVINSTGTVNLDAAEDIRLHEADGLTVQAVTSRTGTADLTVDKGRLNVLNANAAEHLKLTASTGELSLGEGSASAMMLTAGNNISLTTVDATAELDATAGHDISVGALTGSFARLKAGNEVAMAQATVSGALDVEAGNAISIASVTSPEMRLVSTPEDGSVTVDVATMRNAVVRGGNVSLTGRHDGGEGKMILDVEAAGGQASQTVNLTLKAAPGVEITNLQAVNADIRVASDDLLLSSARILKRGDIRNDFNHIITDNDNLTPQACTLQLYPEDKRFSAHVKKANDVTTTARVVNYDDNFITNEFSTENSMVRQAEKELAQAAAPASKPTGKAPKKQIAMGKVSAPAPTMIQPISMPVGTPPVALGDESMATGETLDLVAP